jgi:T-complex protein 1 subunit delta
MPPFTAGETLQERSKGKDVRLSNIVAAKAVAAAVRTSLGPRGMDKLMQMPDGEVLISNDGATILSKLNVLHPAAKMLVELSQSQDIEAGDGTTTVVVMAGALLDACEGLLGKGIHPTMIATSFLKAATFCTQTLQAMSKPVDLTDRDSLLHAVETCLSSKVVAQNTDLLAPIAVDSVLGIMEHNTDGTTTSTNVDLRDIRLVEQMGGTVDDTELVQGLVLHKGSTKTAGGPSQMHHAKIALLQYCLSAPKTDMDNNVVVSDYAAMDRILREERKYILGQCKAIKKSGANVVLIQKSILRDAYNELSLHFLAKMDILVVTDIERNDIDFICRTLGCIPIAHPDQCTKDKLGEAEHVGDVVMDGGGQTVVTFTGVQNASKTRTVLLRGSNDLVLAEASRSLHDAQCVVRSLVKQRALIAGGGAAECEASYQLHQHAQSLVGGSGLDAHCMQAFADALEVIPYTLAENAGMKPMEVVTELRKQHAQGIHGAGINVKVGKVSDMYELNVIQPLLVSTSAIQLATETVCMILKVDDLIVVA